MIIWDTKRQESFKNITKQFFKGAEGIIFVYNISDRRSFEFLENALKVSLALDDTIKILIGNKIDNYRVVSYEEGKNFAESNGIKFIETCPETNENINEAFEMIAKEILKKNVKENVKLDEQITVKKKEKKKKNIVLFFNEKN